MPKPDISEVLAGALLENDQLRARVAELETVLRECHEVLSLCHTKPWYPSNTPEFVPVHELCGRHGYGAVIACASSQWMEALKGKGYDMGGAHTAGPCASTVEVTLGLIDQALKR